MKTLAKKIILLCILLLIIIDSILSQTQTSRLLTIEEAKTLSVQQSDSLKASNSLSLSAKRAIDAAKAGYYPHISASIAGSYLVNPPKGKKINAGELGTLPLWVPETANPGTSYNGNFAKQDVPLPDKELTILDDALHSYFKVGINLVQPIYVWDKIKNGVKLAELEAEMAELRAHFSQKDVARAVNAVYFSALVASKSEEILTELQASIRSIVADFEKKYQQGSISYEQVLATKSTLAELDTKLQEASTNKAQALLALEVMTGIEHQNIVLSSTFRTQIPTVDPIADLPLALFSTADYSYSQVRLKQASITLALRKGQAMLLPDFNLFINFDVTGQDIPFTRTNWTKTWDWDLQIGLAAKLELFDGLASYSRIDQAKSDLAAAEAATAAEKQAVKLKLHQSAGLLKSAFTFAEEKEKKKDWMDMQLKNTKSRYEEGILSRSDMNFTIISAATAQLEYISAQYNLEQKIADIERLLGKEQS